MAAAALTPDCAIWYHLVWTPCLPFCNLEKELLFWREDLGGPIGVSLGLRRGVYWCCGAHGLLHVALLRLLEPPLASPQAVTAV